MGNVAGSLVGFIPALILLTLWWKPKAPALRRAIGLVLLLLCALLFLDCIFGPFNVPVDLTIMRWLSRLMAGTSAVIVFGYAGRKFVTDWRRATEKRRAAEASGIEV